MKKMLVVKLAVAAMLVLGSLAQAQEKAVSPTPDDGQAAPAQDSASDAVADEVAPVQPVDESVISSAPIVSSSGCVGCGQATPAFGVPMTMSPIAGGPIPMGCGSGCSGCGTVQMAAPMMQPSIGCGSCGQIGQVSYNQPSIGCGSCGQIGQVSYDQPISIVANPITVNPAPMVVAPQSSCCNPCNTCSPCNTCAPAPVATTCCDCCSSTRGRLRGRVFRNR